MYEKGLSFLENLLHYSTFLGNVIPRFLPEKPPSFLWKKTTVPKQQLQLNKRVNYKGRKDTLLLFSSSVHVILLYSVLSDPSPTPHSQGLVLLIFCLSIFWAIEVWALTSVEVTPKPVTHSCQNSSLYSTFKSVMNP